LELEVRSLTSTVFMVKLDLIYQGHL